MLFRSLKLRWLLDHVPGARARAEAGDLAFGTVDTWLVWHLTGLHVTDVTNASRTQLMNLATLDWDALGRQLSQLAPDPALHYAASDAALGQGGSSVRAFHAPTSSDELAALLLQDPKRRLLGGATDIGLWVNKQFRDLGEILYIGAVPELQRIECVSDGLLRIGAGVSLERAWAALVERAPELREVALRFASPPVRHAGTLAGNLANGSDRKSTRLNSSHIPLSRMPSSA